MFMMLSRSSAERLDLPSTQNQSLLRHTVWLEGRTAVLPLGGPRVPARHRDVHLQRRRSTVLLETIAQRQKATPAQIALAWVLAQKSWIVPIPGTTKLYRLQENFAAASIELSEGDLREMERATSEITIQGARYSEGAQRMINR
jgi:diketogulonate reductase-like aldo/keto reductase